MVEQIIISFINEDFILYKSDKLIITNSLRFSRHNSLGRTPPFHYSSQSTIQSRLSSRYCVRYRVDIYVDIV